MSADTQWVRDEGWLVDDDGQEWGYCNSCGEEAEAETECCEDGEVVPYNEVKPRSPAQADERSYGSFDECYEFRTEETPRG